MRKELEAFATHCIDKGGLTEEEFAIFEAEILPRKLRRGEVIQTPGILSAEVYYVNDGLLRAYAIDEDGKEHVVQFASPGWFITDQSHFADNENTIVFIDAIEKSEILVFNDELFMRMSVISPKFSEFHRRMLHRRIHIMQKRTIRLISYRAKDRYLDFINTYPLVVQKAPQWMIASYLGITPESLSRVRKELAGSQEI